MVRAVVNLLRPAAFVDRDGTMVADTGYLSYPSDVTPVRGALEGLRQLQALGFALVVVSNQSGVGRGIISRAAALEVHARVESLLKDNGIRISDWEYCWHAPWAGCECRKPSPGLLLRAAKKCELDLPSSIAVGDEERDLVAGRRAGCRSTFRIRREQELDSWVELTYSLRRSRAER